MTLNIEILIIAVIVSISCSISGVFLVLRNSSMIVDSITHTLILGIVLAFMLIPDLHSPFLLLGAAIISVLSVFIIETLKKTNLMPTSAAIGVVFPMMFALGVFILNKLYSKIHIDVDMVLLGDLAFAPFQRFVLFGVDIGAKGIYVSILIFVINLLFTFLFFKELKLSTFDSIFAFTIGFSPALLHYIYMFVVSFTAVGSFEVAGSILVIALMVTPASSAYIVCSSVKKMFIFSVVFAFISSVLGVYIAILLDVSIAGMIATMSGFLFLITFLISKNGLAGSFVKRYKQKELYKDLTLLLHLRHHEGTIDEKTENAYDTLEEHLHWDKRKIDKVTKRLLQNKYIESNNGILKLTEKGLQEIKNIIPFSM